MYFCFVSMASYSYLCVVFVCLFSLNCRYWFITGYLCIDLIICKSFWALLLCSFLCVQATGLREADSALKSCSQIPVINSVSPQSINLYHKLVSTKMIAHHDFSLFWKPRGFSVCVYVNYGSIRRQKQHSCFRFTGSGTVCTAWVNLCRTKFTGKTKQ